MVGHGGSSAGSYLADPTSPIPSHCASIVATSTVRVNVSLVCFQTVTKLKYHRVVHTKESPYVCKSCDKVFTQPWTLKKHNCKFEREGEETREGENVTMIMQNGQFIQENPPAEPVVEVTQSTEAVQHMVQTKQVCFQRISLLQVLSRRFFSMLGG